MATAANTTMEDERWLRVLGISLDSTVLGGNGVVEGDMIQRTRYYAQAMQAFDLIVYSATTEGPQVDIAPNVRIYPTRSTWKPLFVYDAYRVGAEICRSFAPDIIHTQDIYTTGLVAYMLKRRFDIPVCFCFHGDMLGNKQWIRERLRHRIYNRLGLWLLQHGDALRVVSRSEREKLIRLGVPEDRIWTLGSMNDFRQFLEVDARAMRSRLVCSGRFSQVVLFAGRLVDQKDLPTLLAAMVIVVKKMGKGVVLVLVGEGPRRRQLEVKSRELGLADSVRFVGRVDYQQVPEYLGAADVLALSSGYEGNARILAEAAACATPVVATDVSGTRDTVVDGVTGFIVPPRDPHALANALLRILEDPQRARQMGLAGREYVLQKYTPEALLPGFKEMWETTVVRYRAKALA